MNLEKKIGILISVLIISLVLFIVLPKISPAITELLTNQPAQPYDPAAAYTGNDLLILAPKVMFLSLIHI